MSRPVRRGDLVDRLGEGQQARAGQLVQLADVAVIGERGDGDVGDVVGVDERLGGVAGRERHLAAEHVVEHVVLAEVLREPRRAHDGQRGTGGPHGLLGELGLGLAAPGQAARAAARRGRPRAGRRRRPRRPRRARRGPGSTRRTPTPTPSRAGAQVRGSSQSNGGWPSLEPIRTGRPRAVSRWATRRPVLPVPPSTRVVFGLRCVWSWAQ